MEMYVNTRKRIWIVRGLVIILIILAGTYFWSSFQLTEDEKLARLPCDPIVAEDNFYYLKAADSGVALKLPHTVGFRRSRLLGCDIAKTITGDYLWHEKKLVPLSLYTTKVPKDAYMAVRIYYKHSWASVDEMLESIPDEISPWQLDPAIPHIKFPLEYYPRFYWDDPENPSKESLHRAKSTQVWGIRDTKYRAVGTGRPFFAYCSIPVLDPNDLNGHVKSDFSRSGDSKCRGRVSASRNGKVLYFMVDVWAYLGTNQAAIKDINLIYDAVVEELHSFIQE